MTISQINSVVNVRFHTDESDTDKGFKYSLWSVVADGEEPTANTTTQPEANERFCGGTITEMDCCEAALDGQCGYGQGDCDADEQCAGDLR